MFLDEIHRRWFIGLSCSFEHIIYLDKIERAVDSKGKNREALDSVSCVMHIIQKIEPTIEWKRT